MACPLFNPREPDDSTTPPDRPRPPLGRVWRGVCLANGEASEPPADAAELCNFGYARGRCARLPDQAADAVRFSVVETKPESVSILWLVERDCLPQSAGAACFRRAGGDWSGLDPDSTLGRQATAYVRSCLEADSQT